MPFVIDASVTMAWLAHDEADPAPAVLRAIETEQALVPSLWPLEVASAVLSAQRRGRFTSDDVQVFAEQIGALMLGVDDPSIARALDVVVPLANQYRLSVYDAAYLELALRERLPLATIDTDVADAALQAGVVLLS